MKDLLFAIGCFVERDSQDQMNFKDILELIQERKDLLVLLVTNDLCDQTILQNMQKLTWRVARPVIQIQRAEVMEVPPTLFTTHSLPLATFLHQDPHRDIFSPQEETKYRDILL